MSSDFQRIGGQLGGPASPFNKNASPFNKNASAGFEGAGIDGNIARALISTSLRLDSNDETRNNFKLIAYKGDAALFRLDSEVRVGICSRSLSTVLLANESSVGKLVSHFKTDNNLGTDFISEIIDPKKEKDAEGSKNLVFRGRAAQFELLEAEAKKVYALRDRRPDYEDQILTQMDGFWPYWTALTNICPVRCPFTAELMTAIASSALNIVQDLKYRFSVPRPVDVIPGIMPMIRTPGHGSYPSGHATLSHLEANVLNFLLDATSPTALNKVAERISKNREIAGVHYERDTGAGESLALIIFTEIKKAVMFPVAGEQPTEFQILANAALTELHGLSYRSTPPPEFPQQKPL